MRFRAERDARVSIRGIESQAQDDPKDWVQRLDAHGQGWYRIRVHATGRDLATGEWVECPVEKYLVMAWPAPRADPVVYRAASEISRYLGKRSGHAGRRHRQRLGRCRAEGYADLNQWSGGPRSRRHLKGDADMQESKPKAAASRARRKWPLAMAIGALVAVLGTAGWAGYRMVDPVEAYGRGDAICHSTGLPDVTPGFTATPVIKVKPGRWLDVRSIGLVDGENYRLAGTGVQNQGAAVGAMSYPVVDDGTPETAAWLTRLELPATLGDGSNESVVMALEPVDASRESSLRAVHVEYRNEWGIPYSIDVGPRFTARPDCSVDPEVN